METIRKKYSMSTQRTARLKADVLSAPREISTARARILTEAFQRHADKPLILKRALAYQAILENVPITIHQDELIVGGFTEKRKGAFLMPENNVDGLDLSKNYNQAVKGVLNALIQPLTKVVSIFNKPLTVRISAANLLFEQALDTFENRSSQRFSITEDEKQDLAETIFPYWKNRDGYSLYRSFLTPEEKRLMNQFAYAAEHAFVGGVFLFHPHLEKSIQPGLMSIIELAERKISERRSDLGDTAPLNDFYEAMIISCRAVIAFANRYAARAETLAATTADGQRRAELLHIADMCRHVPANPPRSFYEGMQSLFLTYIAVAMDDGGHEIPFGRWDQALYPLYKRDLETGETTKEQALELIEAFLIKINEFEFLLNNKARLFEDGNSGRLTLTIGGVDQDGRDATNDLSCLFLEALSNTRMIRPNPAVRLHRETPEPFLNQVVEIMASGANTIQVFNDEAIVQGFLDAGFPAADARDYIIGGCVQPIPKSTYGSVCAAHLALPKTLELFLRKHRQAMEFDEFYREYKAYLSGIIKNITRTLQASDRAHKERLPTTFVSALTDGTMETGRDVKEGGAKHNLTGISLLGLGTLADSLMAIKHAVFDERRFTLAELNKMLDRDFSGFEAERLYLLNKIPKYGNDNDEVDRFVREISDFCNAEEKQYATFRGGQYSLGAHSENGQVVFGLITGATPDGRKQMEPLSVGAGSARGRETQGCTAALKSVSKINASSVISGISVNVRLHPSLLEGQQKIRRFRDLISTYFYDYGGQNLQANVVSTEILRAAQKNPAAYRDLLVRISGYSATFVDLTKYTQEEIIARTEYLR
jgi:pyruvate formate-lyase/glycerol dehydratase family glycyl radical enzyme